VTNRLLDPAVRLLTLVGPGGTGKTRLALEAAGCLAAEFTSGIFVVDLAPLTDPGLVTSAIARVLGVREVVGQALLETAQNRLRDEHLLLVADNFEHLLDGASVIASLLLACPRFKVLATSRTPLGVYGEHQLHVPPLGLPDLRASDPNSQARAEAVRLFVDRASARLSNFRLDSANTRIVAEICVRLDGLPLAIELAAARVQVLPPRALLARLTDPLSVLTGGAQTVPTRHQTLRATLDWSYSLLGPAEQALLRRLAVFAGGWTLEAADVVCADDQGSPLNVLDSLEKLARASLVRVMETEPEARFQMLETVREYGREQLVAHGALDAARHRHATFFLALAERAEPELMGPDQLAWLDHLEREHDNLRAAMRWSVESGEVEMGLRIGGALWHFWQMHGHLTEGRLCLMELLELTPTGTSSMPRTSARTNALHAAGSLAWQQGDYASARSLYAESLGIARELEDRRGIAHALNSLGILASDQGDFPAARSLYAESLRIARELEDRREIALSLNNLGVVAQRQGDYAVARSLYEESLAIKRELGDRRGIAMSLGNLGIVTQRDGDYAGARSLYEESLAIQREMGDRRGIAHQLDSLGEVACLQGDYALANSCHKEGLAIVRELGVRRGIAYALEGLARVAATEGRAERALRLAGAAAGLRQAIGAPLPPEEQEQHQRTLQKAVWALGEQASKAAWGEGQTMPLDQALDEATAVELTVCQPWS